MLPKTMGYYDACVRVQRVHFFEAHSHTHAYARMHKYIKVRAKKNLEFHLIIYTRVWKKCPVNFLYPLNLFYTDGFILIS